MTGSATAAEAQVRSADPGRSTWVAANAGSGKTRVLIDRVARLLLAGTEPERILCLTYTKAAAGEMKNRLFQRLGGWAMLAEAELRRELLALGVEGDLGPDRLAEARRLFARAIEAPGGLKIQTIHAFCASLLRRFPLEAGVSPAFSEMEERAAQLLRQDVLEEMAAGADIAAVDALVGLAAEERLTGLVDAVCARQAALSRIPPRAEVLAAVGLHADFDRDRLLAEVAIGDEAALFAGLVPHLLAGGTTDSRLGARLAPLANRALSLRDLPVLEEALLTGRAAKQPFSAKIGSIPTQALRNGPAAPLMPAFEALMARVEAARPRRLALEAAERTLALYRFAAGFLPRYRARKAALGMLDFDDLIDLAAALLNDPSVAQWVLFRLDGGIDHLLVDEAQDTSPSQWRVIERLSEEFGAGEGARGGARTVFVVGDKKQSIYSFQGADLEVFEHMAAHYRARLAGGPQPLQELTLDYSFRSSQAILRLVDLTFDERVRRGLGGAPQHLAFFADRPGRVDLWDPVPKAESTEPDDPLDPVDRLPPTHHSVVLARRIAETVRRMIDTGTAIPTRHGPRAVDEGDILILVQRRSGLFSEIIRACKGAGLAVAGADRLKIGAELAARDLLAVLRFLATPEDDLSLASALRSPLFGLGEGDLYRIAQGRPPGTYLWHRLRGAADRFAEAVAILEDLRNRADFLRPFELIERLLTRHGGRQRLLARLGPEAEDGIDELLAQALAYETRETPSLTGFLVWMDAGDVEVKRQPGSGVRAIRVMTVHGAKGLEAPVVILPDTAKRRSDGDGGLLDLGGLPVWSAGRGSDPEAYAEARNRREERQADERMRLLYVALTRAESWLIVCAAGDTGTGTDSWHALVAEAMVKAGAARKAPDGGDFDFGPGMRLQHGDWPDPIGPARRSGPAAPALPDWALRPAPALRRPAATLAPSGLGGAKAVGEATGDGDAAMRFGTALHRLLEHLPLLDEAEWDNAAADLLSGAEDGLDSAEIEPVLEAARRVLGAPSLAELLRGDGLREVEITGPVAALGGAVVHGTIDRLIVEPDRILAIDYKSNAVVPADPRAVPAGILRQMGAYAALLAQVYPGRRIETAILWTADATLMTLPQDLVAQALSAAAP
ncbi:MAG: double-strand break repair helicase AddA [Pseudomonadota bacterium]